jgi:hypothetical protein
MYLERRKDRSTYKDRALRRWFQSEAERNQLLGFVLADTSGLLVATSLPQRASEEMAAQAPYLFERPDLLQKMVKNEDYPVIVDLIAGQASPLFLCAIGKGSMGKKHLTSVKNGVQRILGLN